jgi:hypothetical protein
MPKTRRAKDGGRHGCDSSQRDRHDPSLALFACPNPDCEAFNRFDGGNLTVCEWIGKDKSIRRLYCNRCQCRFSERQGSLMLLHQAARTGGGPHHQVPGARLYGGSDG